jgi:RNA polymerase sigma-70 factor, ECF subfamily
VPHPPFDEALAPHYEQAVRYCRALCARSSRRAEAEDVLQDALLRALEHYEDLADHGRFKPWLFQIITRTHQNSVRLAYWRRILPSSDEPAYERMPAAYDHAAALGDRMTLERALAKLGDAERAALLLHELGGFSVEEIAGIQRERSVSTIKSRLSRARARLREHVLRAMGESAPSGAASPASAGSTSR